MPVFIGAEFANVVKIDQGVHRITKYDPDSGKPYEKDMHFLHYHVGEKVFDSNMQYFESDINEYLQEKVGLNTFIGDSSGERPFFVGYGLKQLNSKDLNAQGTDYGAVQDVVDAFTKAKEAFRQIGYVGNLRLYETEGY